MRRPLPAILTSVLLVLLLWQGARVSWSVFSSPADEAADALPIYLATVTLAEGGDPGSREALQQRYQERALRVRAATYSTLYPVTLPALMRPFADLDWRPFALLTRGVLLLSLLGCGLAGAWLRPRIPGARLRVALAGALLLALLPASAECVRLGQINMLLALLMMGAMVAVARGWDGTAGGLLALGAATKLVPGLLVLPLLAARRWRVAGVASLVGAGALGLAALAHPLPEIVDGVVQTVRFQGAIHPDWAARHAHPPGWLAFLAGLRHGPLLLMGLAGSLPALAARPSRTTTLAAMALFSAWLGCSAAAFHMLYLPLLYPALLYLVLWPFEPQAPRELARGVAIVVLVATALAFALEPERVVLEARMSLLGMVVWAGCALRLGVSHLHSPGGEPPWIAPWMRWHPVALSALLGALFASAMPAHQPLAPPEPPTLQEVIEVGFIRPGDPVPGPEPALVTRRAVGHHRRTGRWPEVAVGSTLSPGSHGAMVRHLEFGAQRWGALVEDDVAGPWAAWVLEARPPDPVHEGLASELIRYLLRESRALEALGGEELGALRRSHRALIRGEVELDRPRRTLGGAP